MRKFLLWLMVLVMFLGFSAEAGAGKKAKKPAQKPKQVQAPKVVRWRNISDIELKDAIEKGKQAAEDNAPYYYADWIREGDRYTYPGSATTANLLTPYNTATFLAWDATKSLKPIVLANIKKEVDFSTRYLRFSVKAYGESVTFPKDFNALIYATDAPKKLIYPSYVSRPRLADMSAKWPYEPSYVATFTVFFPAAAIDPKKEYFLVVAPQFGEKVVFQWGYPLNKIK